MSWIIYPERSIDSDLMIVEVPGLMDDLDLNFDFGEFVESAPPVIELSYGPGDGKAKLDVIPAAPRMGLLLNAKVRAVFDALAINNIQYFPARLINTHTLEQDNSYQIANVFEKHACVDFERSELELRKNGSIRFIDRLGLNVSKDYGPIFRIAEFHPLLVVSDELKQALEDHQVTGLSISPSEDFEL